MVKSNSISGRIFDICNYVLMTLIGFIMLYPFWNAMVLSFNEGFDTLRGGVYFWPRVWSFESYEAVFEEGSIGGAYLVTIFVTVVGTLFTILGCGLAAYALSRKTLPFRRAIMFYIFFTNVFGGGLIPTYLLYRNIGILDTLWVYILPGVFSFYNILIMKSYFMTSIPESLGESATLDGASELRIFLSIYLPLSKPIIATVALFAAVGRWNDWFTGMYYIQNENLVVLGTLLKKLTSEISFTSTNPEQMTAEQQQMVQRITPESFKMAVLMLTTLPILFVYPFIQKYFVKGVMIGSIKE
ncbi:MAG: carbohydrate ABC transporter permease [Candidatus Merdivicinus sp.]|jgi:putative aldouronate transport system permease protein